MSPVHLVYLPCSMECPIRGSLSQSGMWSVLGASALPGGRNFMAPGLMHSCSFGRDGTFGKDHDGSKSPGNSSCTCMCDDSLSQAGWRSRGQGGRAALATPYLSKPRGLRDKSTPTALYAFSWILVYALGSWPRLIYQANYHVFGCQL